METKQQTLDQRQVFQFINLYLVDVLVELVSVIHADQLANGAAFESQFSCLSSNASIRRARVRLDGARVMFDLLTQDDAPMEATKEAVARLMTSLSSSRPENCVDDAPQWKRFAAMFSMESVAN